MTAKKRLAALAAAAAVGLGSIVFVANPASAAATCSTTKLSGTWLGTGGGWRFNCHNNAKGGVELTIGCANLWNSQNRYITYTHRPAGYPWSLGQDLYCNNAEVVGPASWRPL